jgi:hypothetical protein
LIDEIKRYFEKCGITYDNQKQVIWLSQQKGNLDNIKDNAASPLSLLFNHLQGLPPCRGVSVHPAGQSISSEGVIQRRLAKKGRPSLHAPFASGGSVSHPLQPSVRLAPPQCPARFAIGTGIMFSPGGLPEFTLFILPGLAL